MPVITSVGYSSVASAGSTFLLPSKSHRSKRWRSVSGASRSVMPPIVSLTAAAMPRGPRRPAPIARAVRFARPSRWYASGTVA